MAEGYLERTSISSWMPWNVVSYNKNINSLPLHTMMIVTMRLLVIKLFWLRKKKLAC
jgi:hypothetical protein